MLHFIFDLSSSFPVRIFEQFFLLIQIFLHQKRTTIDNQCCQSDNCQIGHTGTGIKYNACCQQNNPLPFLWYNIVDHTYDQ